VCACVREKAGEVNRTKVYTAFRNIPCDRLPYVLNPRSSPPCRRSSVSREVRMLCAYRTGHLESRNQKNPKFLLGMCHCMAVARAPHQLAGDSPISCDSSSLDITRLLLCRERDMAPLSGRDKLYQRCREIPYCLMAPESRFACGPNLP
jgi:hypothetical protein